jgi:hypothetical protein
MSARPAGQFLRERVREKMIVGLILIVCSLATAVLGFRWWWVSLLGLPLAYVLNREMDNEILDPLKDLRGYAGERRIGEILASLSGSGVLVEHDVVLGPGNIDHVVLAPAGVFTLETKHWEGRFFTKDGHLWHSRNGVERIKDDLLEHADADARRVRGVLRVNGIDRYVTPVIVSTKAKVWRGEFVVGRVRVVHIDGLPYFFEAAHRLGHDELVRAKNAVAFARRKERSWWRRIVTRLWRFARTPL